jgi:hypothetical protein
MGRPSEVVLEDRGMPGPIMIASVMMHGGVW